jgi:predicted transport protein
VSDIKLFRIENGVALELFGSALAVEKSLQGLIERNLEAMLGVRFLATEYSTGKAHGGRIDSLGLDENGSPVIIEYKRATNENVINQGLFYLDWLLDHRGEFTLLAMKALGAAVEEEIDWSAPRLVCVAGDFTRYDEHAVAQIGRNIELYRYRSYGEGFFVLELVNRTAGVVEADSKAGSSRAPAAKAGAVSKTVSQFLEQSDQEPRERYSALDAFLLGLGDDISVKVNKNYFAYRRIKNIACVEVHPQTAQLLVYLKVNPDDVALEPGFSRDVRSIGHFGTGELEVRLRSVQDLERAKPLIEKSYDAG